MDEMCVYKYNMKHSTYCYMYPHWLADRNHYQFITGHAEHLLMYTSSTKAFKERKQLFYDFPNTA